MAKLRHLLTSLVLTLNPFSTGTNSAVKEKEEKTFVPFSSSPLLLPLERNFGLFKSSEREK